MRRYTNWSIIFFLGLMVIAAFTSSIWIPEVQPDSVAKQPGSGFDCPGFVSGDQCKSLRDVAAIDENLASALRESLNPDNDLEVLGEPEISALARQVNESTSDEPIITTVKIGSFAPLDVIRNAEGIVSIYEILHGGVTARYLRFEDPFKINSGPDLELFLSTLQNPRSAEEFMASNPLEIAFLKGNIGPQNYELSNDIDLTQLRSAVIYSKSLDLIFAVAPIVTN